MVHNASFQYEYLFEICAYLIFALSNFSANTFKFSFKDISLQECGNECELCILYEYCEYLCIEQAYNFLPEVEAYHW